MTSEKEKAIFYEEGQAPIEGLKQVKRAVEELLHIDEKQFKQIVMIAQGEFRDLLNAKTEQRTKILRTIFLTGGYKNIEDRLKDRMDASGKIKAKAEASMIQHFGDVSADEADEISDELEELKSRAAGSGSTWNLEEILDVMERLILSDQERLKCVEADLKKAEAELEQTNKKLVLARTNNSFIEKREKLEKEKEDLKKRQTEIDEKRLLLDKQKKATRNVNPSYVVWRKKCEEVSGIKNQINTAKTSLEEAKAAVKQAEVALDGAKKREPEVDRLKQVISRIDDEEQSMWANRKSAEWFFCL